MNIFNKLTTFLKETRIELKKVNWPTRQDTLKYTLIVIGVSLGVAVYLGGIDYFVNILLNKVILAQ